MSERDEDAKSLKALRDRMRSQLRAGLENVSRLEEPCDRNELEQWMHREIEQYGGLHVKVDDDQGS